MGFSGLVWMGSAGETSRGLDVGGSSNARCWWCETKAAGFDADAQAAIQQDIRTVVSAYAHETSSSARLLMSGPGVFAVEIQRTIEQEIWWLSTAAATLVVLFLYASYRSLTLVLLQSDSASSGILAGMVAVNGWFGFVHGITLGFGITLLGVVDDYPIHLFSHLSSEGVCTGDDAGDLADDAARRMLTTAIGFSSLLLAGFPALAQLGLFAVAGWEPRPWSLDGCSPSVSLPGSFLGKSGPSWVDW